MREAERGVTSVAMSGRVDMTADSMRFHFLLSIHIKTATQ